MSALARYIDTNFVVIIIFRVRGSNISGEINYPPLQSMLNANSRGIKYFKGVKLYQKLLFWRSKIFGPDLDRRSDCS